MKYRKIPHTDLYPSVICLGTASFGTSLDTPAVFQLLDTFVEQGFFTGRANPDNRSDAQFVRSWYSEEHFRCLDRVNALAKKRGVLPLAVALAYMLYQPFPTFPLIGLQSLSEICTSLQALDIELTPQEVRWLNLED